MQRLCASSELPEASSRGFSIQAFELLVVRRNGQVYAYQNLCPHRQVSLNWQADQFLDDSNSLLRCAQHGALFLVETGECLSGPCAGKSLKSLACIEKNGAIWLHEAL